MLMVEGVFSHIVAVDPPDCKTQFNLYRSLG